MSWDPGVYDMSHWYHPLISAIDLMKSWRVSIFQISTNCPKNLMKTKKMWRTLWMSGIPLDWELKKRITSITLSSIKYRKPIQTNGFQLGLNSKTNTEYEVNKLLKYFLDFNLKSNLKSNLNSRWLRSEGVVGLKVNRRPIQRQIRRFKTGFPSFDCFYSLSFEEK